MTVRQLALCNRIPSAQQAQVTEALCSAPKCSKVEVPKVGADEVLVKLKYSGICHTDFHIWKGDMPIQPKSQLIGGHEGTGIVVAKGEDVKDITLGDPVGIQWVNRCCGSCEFCSTGSEPLCAGAKLSGATVNGTFQQYAVCKATCAVRIPEGIPLDVAAPILCAGVAVYKAIKESNTPPGKIVAVVGAGGGLGSLACLYAKACGYRVLAISSGSSKKQMCLEMLGADYFVDYNTSTDLVSEVKSITGGGPHTAIVVAATEKPYNQAVEYIRPRGTVVIVGIPPGNIQASVYSTVVRMVTIKGSYVGSRSDTEEALRVFAKSGISLPYELFSLEELPKIYDLMSRGEMRGRAVIQLPEVEDSNLGLTLRIPSFSQSQYQVGTYLAYRLEEIGVRDYFVVPGDFNLNLLDQLLQNKKLQMIGCCNELNAGYAADGYARSSPSRVAVVVVTFMVGGLSLLNAIAGAYSEGLRVIVISGCPKTHTFGRNQPIHHSLGGKDRDQALRMFQEVTAASVRLTNTEDPIHLLDKTILQCLERSLPVYIEIPADMADVACNPPLRLSLTDWGLSQPDKVARAVEAIINAWACAKSPIILVGTHLRHVLTTEALVALITKLGCAVFCQPDGKSLVPESHPQFVGTFWSYSSTPGCQEIVMDSDLWIVLGGRWTDFHTFGSVIDIDKEGCRIVDLQPECVTTPNTPPISGVLLAEVVAALVDSNIASNSSTIRSFQQLQNGSIEKQLTDESSPLTVNSVVNGIQRIIKSDDTLIAEAGDSWFNAQRIRLPPGSDFQMQFLYGSIGWSLPAALGCQLARPNGRAVLMIGDGSFQMTAQELSTMIRAKANCVIFIFNNLGYGIETAIHDGPYNYISNWNYTSFASTLCNRLHSTGNGNPYLQKKRKDEMFPSMFTAQVKTHGELMVALDYIEQGEQTLSLIECCIQGTEVSPSLCRLASVISGKVQDS